MKERSDLKHLIPWIKRACDENLFPGLLGWKNRAEKIFFVTWVHKSSESWEKSKSTVFEAWANYKKKLGGKDDRDLKAAFRNALRSKKNSLTEISRSRNERTWKIISDTTESTSSNKVNKTRQKKTDKNITRFSNTRTSTTSVSMQSTSSACSTTSYNTVIPNEFPLPSCQTLLNVSPPTPPNQQTDVCFETLAPKTELFHLHEEIMNLAQPSILNSMYRVPSPLAPPESFQPSNFNDMYRVPSPTALPESPITLSFFDVFSEVDKNTPQTMSSTESFANSQSGPPSQLVPISQQEWNPLNQIINFNENQFPREIETQQTNQQLLNEELCTDFDLFTWDL